MTLEAMGALAGMARNIIIDCDPGIDDALAIFMALSSSRLNVLGITTVAGNVNIDLVTRNALSLLSVAGRRLPVCRGASGPFLGARREGGHVHGENGLGGIELPEPIFGENARSATDFIKESAEAYSGNLDLVAIGPLTNIASVLTMYPALTRHVRRITMMGGSAGSGNVSPAAEFNIFADPHAAAAVFQSGIPIDMYGLNVTNRAYITDEEVDALRATGKTVPLLCCSMLRCYADFYRSVGRSGLALHDPFAMACVIDESLAERKECHVAVETHGKITRGKTVVDFLGVTGKPAQTRVAMELNREGFIRLMSSLLCAYQ